MRKTFFVLVGSGLLLAGCGSKTLGSTLPKTVAPADTPQKNPGCPSVAPDAYHTVTLSMPHALPAKIAMKFPADTDLRVTECPQGTKQTGVTASLTRVITPANTLVITVRHNYTFVQNGVFDPPNGQAFELFEVKCDGTAPVSIYKTAQPIPLSWVVQHPNGTSCAEQDVGTGTATAVDAEGQGPL